MSLGGLPKLEADKFPIPALQTPDNRVILASGWADQGA